MWEFAPAEDPCACPNQAVARLSAQCPAGRGRARTAPEFHLGVSMSVTAINSTSASALALLTGSTKALQATQTQVASGLRVREAADNASLLVHCNDGRAHSIRFPAPTMQRG